LTQPTIDPQYFSHPFNLEIHGRHTQWLETIAAAEPMASLLKKDGRRIHSDKLVHDLEIAKKIVGKNVHILLPRDEYMFDVAREAWGVVNE